MADPTILQTNIWRSIKKFFIDGIGESTDIHFDRILTSPFGGSKQWICILLEQIQPRVVSSAFMPIYMFSKDDPEGDDLIALRDTVITLLYDGRIDLYDTYKNPWEKAGGIVLNLGTQSKLVYNPDQTKMISISPMLKWGAKW